MSSSIALLVALQLTGMTASSTLPNGCAPSAEACAISRVVVTAPVQARHLSERRLELPRIEMASGLRPQADVSKSVDYSDWYYRRLDIHRWGSYAMVPLFIAQYVVGTKLESGDDSDWAEDVHPMLAGGVAALFASNSVTGVWNLWEGRKDPNDRTRRFLHAGLMLLADAGFVATGILADEAEDDGGGAGAHKTVAIASMTVATLGWAIMLDIFRPD